MDAPVKMIFPGHSRISLWHKNVAGIAGSRSAPRGYEESYSRTGILLRSFTDALQILQNSSMILESDNPGGFNRHNVLFQKTSINPAIRGYQSIKFGFQSGLLIIKIAVGNTGIIELII